MFSTEFGMKVADSRNFLLGTGKIQTYCRKCQQFDLDLEENGAKSLTLFYTRGLGIVVLHVMVPQLYRFSL
jgi:hypothetical protein